MILLSVFILLLGYAVSSIEGYAGSCSHVPVNVSEIVTGIEIAPLPFGYLPRSVTATGLRIHFEYLDSFNSASGSERLKRDVLEPARSILEKKIRVTNPTQGVLRVDRKCTGGTIRINNQSQIGCAVGCLDVTSCSGVAIPDKYLNGCKYVASATSDLVNTSANGVGEPNVDIIIMVNYKTCPTDVLASAGSCFQESQRDRPILGVMNLCSTFAAGRDIRTNINIVKHELIHALGFATDKYAFYRNADGTPIVTRDKFGYPNLGLTSDRYYYQWNTDIIKVLNRDRSSVSTNTKMTFNAFVLPNVVQVARDHFNCLQLNEVDLENSGGLGSALSHFDEYLLNDELMTPQTNGPMDSLSQFTLALLKDTGWYDTDLSSADEFMYGKNAGCTMPMKGCYAYMEEQQKFNRPIDPFCETVDGEILKCSSNRNYYEYCAITRYRSVASNLQYFKSVKGLNTYDPSLYAGVSLLAEYCPLKLIVNSYGTDDLNSDCKDTVNQGKSNSYTPIVSSYEANALCFDTILDRRLIYGASCLKYEYDGNGKFYNVYVDSKWITCREGRRKDINNGYIKCVTPSSLQKNADQITARGFHLTTIKRYYAICLIIIRMMKL